MRVYRLYTHAHARYVLDDETKAPAAGGGGSYVVDGVTGAARNPVPQPSQPAQPRANRTSTTSTRQGGAEPSRCVNTNRRMKRMLVVPLISLGHLRERLGRTCRQTKKIELTATDEL